MPRLRLHLTNGDTEVIALNPKISVNVMLDMIERGRWINVDDKKHFQGRHVVWVEVLPDAVAGEPA